MTVSVLNSWPVPPFVLESNDMTSLASAADQLIMMLQSENIAHNVLLHSSTVVLVFPRQRQTPHHAGVAIVECCGLITTGEAGDYDRWTEELAVAHTAMMTTQVALSVVRY